MTRRYSACSTLQRTVTNCNAWQRTATHYHALQRTATHCNALQRTATLCNALQCSATHTAGILPCLPVSYACFIRQLTFKGKYELLFIADVRSNVT